MEEDEDFSEDSSSTFTSTEVLLRDFVAGTVGGIAQVVVGHPLDTIKVRLQTSGQYSGILGCVRSTLKEEGVKGFYKGMVPPLMGIAALNAIVFACYGQAKEWIEPDPEKSLTVLQCGFAGAYAGIVQCLVVCPMELVKTRLQVQTVESEYKGPLDVIRKTLKNHGLRGMYQGMNVTLLRETPAYFSLFVSYEWLRLKLTPEGESVDDLSPGRLLLAGGVAGVMCWIVTYPLDTVKSRIQSEPYLSTKYRKQFFDGGLLDTWRQSSRADLWKGFNACMLRAFPANAASFLGVQVTMKLIGGPSKSAE